MTNEIEPVKIPNSDLNPKRKLQKEVRKLLKIVPKEHHDNLLDISNRIKEIEIPNNSVASTIEQVEDYLNFHWEIRFNIISLEWEFKNPENLEWEKLNENEVYRDVKKSGYKIPMSDLMVILKSNFTPKFDPFKDYFEKLPEWNGYDHIQILSNYLELGDQKGRFKTMLLKWMVRSIACAFGEIFNKQALVLIGDQNNGKSSFLRWLCPLDLLYYYKEDINTDKDGRISLATNFIINIDEFSSMEKKDIQALKSMMSKSSVKDRIPWDRLDSRIIRRANFLASTDRTEFLSDEAGSVRWVCFRVDRINWDYCNDIDIDELWSQAYHYYKLGKDKFNPQNTREENNQNHEYNLQFYIKGAEHEAIAQCFSRGTKDDYDKFLTSSEAFELIRIHTHLHSQKMSVVSLGKAFRFLGYEQDSKYEGDKGYSIKGYFVKLKGQLRDQLKPTQSEQNDFLFS